MQLGGYLGDSGYVEGMFGSVGGTGGGYQPRGVTVNSGGKGCFFGGARGRGPRSRTQRLWRDHMSAWWCWKRAGG